jgi:hypothetical protein
LEQRCSFSLEKDYHLLYIDSVKLAEERGFKVKKRLLVLMVAVLAISVMSASDSYAAGKEGFGAKIKNFWKNLLGYPARVTEESASVVADTTKKSASVVANELKRVAEVTTGDVAKTKELITEPITGTAETAVKAAEGVISIPSEAAKEKTETQAATETK